MELLITVAIKPCSTVCQRIIRRSTPRARNPCCPSQIVLGVPGIWLTTRKRRYVPNKALNRAPPAFPWHAQIVAHFQLSYAGCSFLPAGLVFYCRRWATRHMARRCCGTRYVPLAPIPRPRSPSPIYSMTDPAATKRSNRAVPLLRARRRAWWWLPTAVYVR